MMLGLARKCSPSLTRRVRINGTVEANAAGNLDPFVVEVFAGAGECLRVAGVAQGADLEATLVAPSGRVWQDDDSGGSNLPLIKAIAPTRGWHVLVFSQFAGTPSSTIDFTFDISRLPSTSSLCTPATPPRIAAAPAAKAFAEISAVARRRHRRLGLVSLFGPYGPNSGLMDPLFRAHSRPEVFFASKRHGGVYRHEPVDLRAAFSHIKNRLN